MLVLAVLWTAFFVINFNIAMMIPLLPFIQQEMGLTPRETALVLAAFPVVALASNLALGPFIDRYGRKRFIITGALGCTLIFLLTAVASNAWGIALGRAAVGLFMPMVGASVFAAIADYVPAPDRVRITGYVTSAAPIAFLLCMSIGLLLGGLISWRLPVILLALVTAALAAATWTLPPTRPDAMSSAPITGKTYRDRLLSLSLDTGTQRVLLAYFCWGAAVYIFLGLYPSWIVQHGLSTHGVGAISAMLLFGEVGGLFGALLSGGLSQRFAHPLRLCTLAAGATALMVLIVPFGSGNIVYQALAYVAFAFGRDLMLALILGGSMMLVGAAQRGSLNAIMNAIYQTGATVGGAASAWLYGVSTNFTANAMTSCMLFAASGLLLWSATRPKAA
jgi:predicted MFS family arabinose efflux permease